MNNSFGPQNSNEAIIFAQENFRIDVQLALSNILDKLNVSYEELAFKLKMNVDIVYKYFSDEYEMTIRELGAICFVLNITPSELFNNVKN